MAWPIRIAAQVVIYAACAGLLGYFAAAPSYRAFPADAALIKMSFSHASAPRAPCRQLTAEEIAQLAPNMRRSMDCPRERVDLLVELALDGERIYRAEVPPSGLHSDGEASVYEKFTVPSGEHHIAARLRDSVRPTGFDYQHEAAVQLTPGQNFVIDFDTAAGGFVFP
jgi:hypothetical protein